MNPQAQLVSIKEVIQTNKSSLVRLSVSQILTGNMAGFQKWLFFSVPQALLSGGSNILLIRSSVAFVAVSASASPGYRAMPTINAKLPADFFFPFV